MGLLKKLKSVGGGVSKDLLENGQLGRGIVTDLQLTNVSTGPQGFEQRVCQVTVEVALDDHPRYQATVRQAIPQYAIGQFQPGSTVVAVRVNPEDPQDIALDLGTEPPTVTMGQDEKTSSAADVLARGQDCTVVVVQSQPLGMKNPAGIDLHAFLFTVMARGQAPYQVQVGNPVPPDGLPLVYPGSNLPAKVLADDANSVVVDWDAAVSAASQG